MRGGRRSVAERDDDEANGVGLVVGAAAGWGGDRTTVFTPGGKASLAGSVGVIYSTWDHEADAIQFYDAAVDATQNMSGGAKTSPGSLATVFTAGARASSVERRGSKVLVLVNAPAASRDATSKQVWKGWKVR